MKFWFCETCGKRLTDGDIDAGAARDKKLKGVFCKDCAVGVLTMEMMPLNETQAKKILKQHEQSESPAATQDKGFNRKPATGEKGSNRAMQPAAADPRRPAKTRATTEGVKPGVMIAGAAGVLALVIVAVLAFGGKKAPAPTPAIEAPARVAAVQPPVPTPSAIPAPPPATPAPPPATPKQPNPAPASAPAKIEPPDVDAKTESDELSAKEAIAATRAKCAALPESDIDGHIKLVEEYLAEYGHTAAALEARRILDGLRSKRDPPAATPAVQAAPTVQALKPAIPAAAKALAEEIRKRPPQGEPAAVQDPLAEVWKEVAQHLRARQLNQAHALLDRRQREMAGVPAELFDQERLTVKNSLALRHEAWEVLRKGSDKPIPLWCNGAQVKATIRPGAAEDSLKLNVVGGAEMKLSRQQLDPRDIDSYAPEAADRAEDLKRRGLLWLVYDDRAKAAEYFSKARDAGLDATQSARLIARAGGKAGGSNPATESWNKADAEFAGENWKQAELLYQQFQKQYPGQKTKELEQRLALLNEILYPLLPGVMATYYRGKSFAAADQFEVRIEDGIHLRRGRPGSLPAEKLSIKYEGLLKLATAGNYKVQYRCSGPSSFSIDDKKVYDDPDGGASNRTVQLTEGLHPFTLLFSNNAADLLVRVDVSKDGGDGHERLYYDPRKDLPLAEPDAAPPELTPGINVAFCPGTKFDPKTRCFTGIDKRLEFHWGQRAPNDKTPADKFCALWTGKLKVDQAGSYVFHADADDAIRVVVGGKPLIEAGGGNANDRLRRVWLDAGVYDFRAEYTEQTENAFCVLAWELPGVFPKQTLGAGALFYPVSAPPEQLPPDPALDVPESELVRGWVGKYYAGLKFDEAALADRRVDRDMTFSWGRTSPLPQQLDEFCVRWSGKVKVDIAGKYRFRGSFDDGATLWIDGKQIFSAWKLSGTEAAGFIPLTRGYHDVTLDYFEAKGLCWMKLFWSLEGGFGDSPLPPHVLYHHPSQMKK